MSDLRLFAVTSSGPQLLPWPAGAGSVHEVFDNLALGVYSALRTFDHYKFLHLDYHLDRTEQSMRLLGWSYRLDRATFCQALHQICAAYPLPDARVRFDVLAEPAASLGSDSRVLIALTPFTPVPAVYYEEGVRVQLAPYLKRENPLVKTASFVLTRRPYPLGHPEAYEHLLVNDAGDILEGSSSNFYAIRAGRLHTAGAGVLEGITRKVVLQLAAELRLPLTLAPANAAGISQLDEAFISSSSRGLVPVVAISGQMVGAGRPGPMTQQLGTAYDAYVQAHIRPALAYAPQ